VSAHLPGALAARRTRLAGDEVTDRATPPGVGAFLLEDLRRTLDERLGGMHLPARLADEGDDRHAPGALPADAPVGAARHHSVDAIAPIGRDPLRAIDLRQRVRPQIVLLHRDEP